MRISTDLNDVQIANIDVGIAYGIEDSAMASHVLSSNIYSTHRVPEAVIRELSTNAQDSMDQAGKGNSPITVHLPTAIEPWLIVKDTGLGMFPKEIEYLLGNYFISLSSLISSANGFFGLGSKAPFAYTSMFTVEAVKDGIHCLYQCYKDTEDRPRMTQLFVESSSEGNSVAVNVPVEAEDFKLFEDAASILYQHFNCIPTFIGLDLTEKILQRKNSVLRHLGHSVEGWKYLKIPNHTKDIPNQISQCYNHINGNSVVMGSVSYPLDLELLVKSKWSTLGSIDLSSMRGLIIELDISVDPINLDTGREKLQYTELTCTVICDKISKIIRYAKSFFAEISDGLSEWDIRALINDQLQGDLLLSLAIEKNKALDYSNFSSKFSSSITMLSLDSKHKLITRTFDDDNPKSKRKIFDRVTPSSKIQVLVKTTSALTRSVLESFLFSSKKTLIIIESASKRKIDMADAVPILNWLGNPAFINGEKIIEVSNQAKDEHRENIRKAILGPLLNKVKQVKSGNYSYSSTSVIDKNSLFETLNNAQTNGKTLYYFIQNERERHHEPEHGTIFLGIEMGFLKPQDNRDTGALCFSKNTLDLLSQFTCLKNIDEAIREVTTNRKHPLFKKVCSAVSVHLIGKNNALGKMKLHREVRRLAIIGDLLDEKSWKLKLITRMYLFEKNIKNTCDTNRNINISDCFWKRHPVLKDSADKKIERLYNRFEKTKEIFQKYPMLDFVMPEPMLQNHSEFSKLSSVVRDYVKMADQQHTVPSTQSPKLRIVK